MITFGDSILYLSILVSSVSLIGLIFKEKNIDILNRFVSPLIFLTAGLLTFAYLLITYYFVVSDFTYEYVWQYSSRDLPLVYKIAGTWAGQPGTYLLWVWVIFISAAWLAQTTKHATALARRTQIITIAAGIYFLVLTLIQTPFKSIYDLPGVPAGFVPPDGSGLNVLLVNFWMTVHPPLIFIGYAAMTIPFATAIVYLLTKDEGWEELGRQWARFTWLFLGMGIAVGGVWAYLVLGWGGFWAWDPVETASFIPWLTLTGYLHATSLHRKNKTTFSIAAPMLAAVSFILILYAAIVVRSGIFNSVHAFGETSTGTLLIISIVIAAVVSLVLGLRRYFEETETVEEDKGLWNKTNVFYITLLLFVILAFISFWGITFPVFIQLTQGLKVNVASDTKNFFNIWSYPFTIILLLALGFCLSYKESDKKTHIQNLAAVAALSVLAMFLRTGNFYVLDHTSPFYVREPTLYKLIGSISLISIFPSLIYAAWSIANRLQEYLRITSLRPRIKGIGIAAVHFGVVFIIFGAIISSSFTSSMDNINIPLTSKGEVVDVGNGYGVKFIDLSTSSLTGNTQPSPGTPIADILSNPSAYEGTSVKISGEITNISSLEGHGTLVELTDNSGSMWAVFSGNITETIGAGLTVTGNIMTGFEQPVLSAVSGDSLDTSNRYNVQNVKLEVYQNERLIGSGVAEYLSGNGGSGTFPMVDRSITGTDVYVIFQGESGGYIPLTLKIIPAVNFAWAGILLFALGIILIMGTKSKTG